MIVIPPSTLGKSDNAIENIESLRERNNKDGTGLTPVE